jgi:hypothetical protein
MPRLHAEVMWVVMFQTASLLAGDPPSPPTTAPPAPAGIAVPADVNHEGEPMHRNLQVLLIMSWKHPGAEAELRRLESVDGAFERLRKVGWRVGLKPDDHLRIVTDDEVRELVTKLDLKSFPSVVALHDGEVIRSFRSGCTTPLDEYTFEWMRSGVSGPYGGVVGQLSLAGRALVGGRRLLALAVSSAPPPPRREPPAPASFRVVARNLVLRGTPFAPRRPARNEPATVAHVFVIQRRPRDNDQVRPLHTGVPRAIARPRQASSTPM